MESVKGKRPYVCPVCKGENITDLKSEKCEICNGTGLIWEPTITD